ncbi:MAG: SHOCT domain-containing protein [Planctomycetes bacterium]|nr:SHOCT domain-containing protein [Planctomycetota bacterium]
MRRRPGLLLLLALSLGCASAPLGADWDDLSPAARDARALDALRDLFASGVGPGGEAVDDRRVVAVDLGGVLYEVGGAPSRLRWDDVEAVEQVDPPVRAGRTADLRLYLREDAVTGGDLPDVVVPRLLGLGLARPYVPLDRRPRGGRRRLVAALEHVRGRGGEAPLPPPPLPPAAVPAVAPVASDATSPAIAPDSTSPPPVAPDATSSPVAPDATSSPPVAPDSTSPPVVEPPRLEPSRLDEVEEALRRLRAWRDEGLITPDEYEAKRRALLEGL